MLPPFKTILMWTLAGHLCFLIFCTLSFSFRSPPPKRQPVVVKTVSLKKPAPKQQELIAAAPQVKKDPPKKPEPKEKPVEKKKDPVPKKKEEPKPQPKTEKAKAVELLAKAQQSLSKIDTNYDKVKPTQSKTVAKLDTSSSDKEAGYVDEVAALLKALLRLPERGDVEIELTIERTGKVSKLTIISAKSAVNKVYVEKAVPDIAFPQFGKHFTGEKNHNFMITLSDIK